MISKDILINVLTEELMTLRELPASYIDLRNHLLHTLNAADSSNKRPELKTMTILMADIRGFSHLIDNCKPEKIIDLLNRYFTAMIDVITNHNGVVDKMMGDAIMAVYGLNERQPAQQARQACLSAVLMQKAMQNINQFNVELGFPPIHVGMSINTGKVLIGEIGSELHSEYTTIGDTVNTALHVEAHSQRGQILLTDSTYQLIASSVEVGPPNLAKIKGIAQPIKLYELISIQHPIALQVPRNETRTCPRIPVNLPLSFQCMVGKTRMNDHYSGEVLDLSYRGMRARTSISLPPMSDICFGLAMGMSENNEKNIRAKILRSTRKEKHFYSSMEFTNIPTSSQSVLHEYIDCRM